LAGAEGIEPSHGGIKIRCLTAWLRPNSALLRTQRWQSARVARTILAGPAARNRLVACGSAGVGTQATGQFAGLKCRAPCDYAETCNAKAAERSVLAKLMRIGLRWQEAVDCPSKRTTGEQMRSRSRFVAAAGLVVLTAWPLTAQAASFECGSRRLTRAKTAICQDQQLSRTDEQLARRLVSLGRRVSLGQYLGLRVWNAGWVEQREGCRTDRGCITATYRAQSRTLDQFQLCLEGSLSRRACLRTAIEGDREALRR
jgi:hypothetical protein